MLNNDHNNYNIMQKTASPKHLYIKLDPIPYTEEFYGANHMPESARNSPRKTTVEKMVVLHELGLSHYESGATTPLAHRESALCIVDFMGKHEDFLKKTGYWKAYKNMQKKEKLDEIRSTSNLSKPSKPYMMDINVQRKVLFNEQKKKHDIVTSPITSHKVYLPTSTERINYLKKALNLEESPKTNHQILLTPPLRQNTLKTKYSSMRVLIQKHEIKH